MGGLLGRLALGGERFSLDRRPAAWRSSVRVADTAPTRCGHSPQSGAARRPTRSTSTGARRRGCAESKRVARWREGCVRGAKHTTLGN
eukprot:4378827-Prymnesium_polylepis.2